MCRKGFLMQSNTKSNTPNQPTELILPQSIVESYARFLVPELRKFYESEQGKQILDELQEKEN